MRKALNKHEIKKLLKKHEWTQRGLARYLEIDESVVSKVLSGEKLSQRVLDALRWAVSVADLRIQQDQDKL